jgi:signal transduction histidine kinase
LSVYDGARFTNYTTNNGLADNLVNAVMEMGDDSLWVILNTNRIQCLVHGRLKNYVTADGFVPVVNKLIKHSKGVYYALTDEGIFKFQNNRFTRVDITDKNGRTLNRYFNRGIEAGNKLIIVTDPAISQYPSPSYLIVCDVSTGKASVSAKPPEIFDVIESPQNEVLVSTSMGIKMLDKDALTKNEIVFTDLLFPYNNVQHKIASNLYFDRDKNLWLTLSDGVGVLDKQGHLKMYSVENGLPVNLHLSVFQDREDIMWFVNDQTGLSKLSERNVEFYKEIKHGFFAADVFADKKSDSVWFVDQMQKNILLQYPGGSEEFSIQNSTHWPYMFTPGTKKNFLTGDYEIYQFDSITNHTIQPQLIYSYRDSFAGVEMVNNPQPDKNGNLLYCNQYINVVFQNKQIVSWPLGYYADEFVLTKDNRLWVITRAGKLLVFRIHPESPDHYFELLGINDKTVPPKPRSIAFDSTGNLWVGTRAKGLFCFTVDDQLHLTLRKQITDKNGLSDNGILNLHADAEGNIWACSEVGLDRVQEKNGKWTVENISRSNNVYQNVLKVVTTKSGEHWALTTTGVIKVKASQKSRLQNFAVNILFTGTRAGKDTLDTNEAQPEFAYSKNDLFFQWAVPSFVDEKQTQFSYRLLGSGTSEWSEPSSNATVRFVNLAPGKYRLQVKAMFPNGLYADTEARYDFEILPPWWQTWWLRALVIIAVLIAIIALVRGYARKKLEKQRRLHEKLEAIEKERARIASDMHDDLGAGLSTIRFLSEKVRRDAQNLGAKTEIEKIATISNEMVESMNEIIWAMNEKNDTLEDLLFYTRSYAKEYCEEHQLDCQFEFPESIPDVYVSGDLRRNVFLTVKESLHNIVKYAGATKVEIQMNTGDHLRVSIKDNGKGFAMSAAQNTSKGNGLRNMKKRIESIGGKFSLETEGGVTIAFNVPLKK